MSKKKRNFSKVKKDHTKEELGIKIGDYYHMSSPMFAFNSSTEYYIRVNSISRLEMGTRFDRYIISGDGFNYILDNGIPKHLKEEIEQKWKLRIKDGSIIGVQKITKKEYDKKLREIKHQLQPETKLTTDPLSKEKIEESKKKEKLNLKVGDWLWGTEHSTGCSIKLESIFFVSKIDPDSIFLENAIPRNIALDQSIESKPWNKANFYKEEGKDIIYFKSEYIFIEFKKISKEEVLKTLRSWSTIIDWTFKRLISDTQPNKKLMTIENFLERGKDFSGKCIIVKPLYSRIATCIKVDRAKRGDEVYMNVEHSSIVFYPEIAFEIPIDSKNSRHCRPEKAFPAGKELLYDTHALIEVISEEEFMTLRNEVSSKNRNESATNDSKNKQGGDKKVKEPLNEDNNTLGKSGDTTLNPKIDKLKKSRHLKYVKDNKIYYLQFPKYETKKIPEQELFLVIASGVTIIDNQVHYYFRKCDPIRLVFENKGEFFNNATEISEQDYLDIWYELLD